MKMMYLSTSGTKPCEASHRGFSCVRKSNRAHVYSFDIGRWIPSPKPPSLEGGIHMCSCHLVRFLGSHIRDNKGRKMLINLRRRKVSCKKQDIKYYTKWRWKQINLETWQGRHFMKEIFSLILVSNGDVLFNVLNSNVIDQSILGFCHRVPNFKSRPSILGSISCIWYFSQENAEMSTKGGHQMST